MKKLFVSSIFTVILSYSFNTNASTFQISASSFIAGSELITFSEFPLGTNNPTYTFGTNIVTFGGWFQGQSLSATPAIDCPGAAATACIVGNPTGSLTLDASAPNTSIVADGSNPTSPVLSGTPLFNGGIAVLFSEDQYGVGFDGGFFDAIGSTAITAFARDGSRLGSISNSVEGIEFLGIADDSLTSLIAGVFLELVGDEPSGFAIDNLRFAQRDQIIVPPTPSAVPLPAAAFMFAPAILGFLGLRRKKRAA